MITEKTLMKFGLIEDKDNSWLKKVFKNNAKLKEIHIDIYSENPLKSSADFMLLLRTIEKKVIISNDGNRLIIKKVVDNFNTYFMSVLFSKITACFYREFSENYFEIILNVQNIYYKITVSN